MARSNAHGRVRRERRQRVHSGDGVVVEQAIAVRSDDDMPLRPAEHTDETDPGSGGQAGEKPGPALVDLLARQTLRPGGVDQAEVSRTQNDEVAGRRGVLVRRRAVLQARGGPRSGLPTDRVPGQVVHDGPDAAPALDVFLK